MQNLNLTQIREKFISKELKPSEVAQSYLEQVNSLNPQINAVINLNKDLLEQAKVWDQVFAQGEKTPPLAGIPVGIKDMFCIKGYETSACSKMLKGFIPPYSATVIKNLEKNGALFLGKLNQDEFAMGSSNEFSYYGPCKNPWDLERVPGGSSGGSAAAVAARMVPASLGTDTGGSVRQPAGFCGIVGLKPTYGRVSRYGIVAFASSLDQAGPMTQTVNDSAIMLEAMAGHDPKDSTSAQRPVETWSQNINQNMKGVKVGVDPSYLHDIDFDVQKVVEKNIENLESLGAEIVEIKLEYTEYAVPVYYMVATSEASSNLARYDGVRFGYRSDFEAKPAKDLLDFYTRNRGEGFGGEVKRRIMIGTYALSSGYYDAYYKKACQVRRLLKESYQNCLNQCDVILGPVSSAPAFKLGDKIKDPVQMFKNDVFTSATNLVGLPGMSVPGGFSKDGLPIGVQLTANYFEEQKLFNVGSAIELINQIKKVPDVIG